MIKYPNDYVDRVPANKVSKSRNGPSGTSVEHFVTQTFEAGFSFRANAL